eukprot:13478467-Ditylum_brightwellii.AAC.1
MRHNANMKCAANNNNNATHNIDGVQVTMIASSINNCEKEKLLANTAMVVRDGNVVVLNTSSYVVPTGNKLNNKKQ